MANILLFTALIDFVVNAIISNLWLASFLNEGLSLKNAAITCGLMRLSTAVFELPTGYLADRYLGRKNATLLGISFVLISLLVLGLSDDGLISKIAMVISGFGITFISGAKQAWIRGIVQNNYPEKLKKLFFEIDIWGRISTIIGIWTGSYLLHISKPNAVWLMGAFACFISILISRKFPGPSNIPIDFNFGSENFEKTNSWAIYILKPGIFVAMIASMLFGLEDGIRDIVFQPTLMELTNSNTMFIAYQSTITLGPRILGSYFYKKKLSNNKNPLKYLFISAVGIAFVELMIPSINTYSTFAIFWSFAVFMFGIFLPLKDTVLNEMIDYYRADKWRATIISVDSLFCSLMQALSCITIANYVTSENAKFYFGYGGVFLFIMGCTYGSIFLLRRESFAPVFNEKESNHE